MQYRRSPKSDAENPLIEHDIFTCESTAYRRLKEKGLCDKGIVPQFFGTMEQIQPELWKPHLNMFLEHDLLPNAILIEYIPDMQMIDLPTFSPDRLDKLASILDEIHDTKVLHRDPYPRNMMIIPGNPDRVLWIDFDRAQTYSYSEPVTAQQQEWFNFENQMMKELAEGLVSHMIQHQRASANRIISQLQKEDSKEGKHRKTFHYYFEGMSPDFRDRACENVT